MSDQYPQDSDAERWPTGPWPGNYQPPGWTSNSDPGDETDEDDA